MVIVKAIWFWTFDALGFLIFFTFFLTGIVAIVTRNPIIILLEKIVDDWIFVNFFRYNINTLSFVFPSLPVSTISLLFLSRSCANDCPLMSVYPRDLFNDHHSHHQCRRQGNDYAQMN